MQKIALSTVLVLMSVLVSAQTWQVLPNSPIGGYMKSGYQNHDDIEFCNENVGWICDIAGQIYKTTDGGDSWANLVDQEGTSYRCLAFINCDTGFVGNLGPGGWVMNTSDPVLMYKTYDGGANWAPVTTIPTIHNPLGICGMQAIDAQNIVAVGRYDGPGIFYKSTDGGDTWTTKDLNNDNKSKGLVDLHFFDPDTGLVAGRNQNGSAVWHTTDGGQNFTLVATAPKDHVWKIYFIDRMNGYFIISDYDKANDRYYYTTTDGGLNWTEKIFLKGGGSGQFGVYEGLAVGFFDTQVGWCAGSAETYETKDGGATFKAISIDPTYDDNINRFYRLNATTMYAVGTRVYKYTDLTVGTCTTDPSVLSSTITSNSPLCDGFAGWTWVMGSGGTGSYSYLWNTGGTTDTLTLVSAGTYTVTITDANGCTLTNSETVVSSPSVSVTSVVTQPSCGACDGAIDISVSGGTPPFSYFWSTFYTGQNTSGLCPGTYTVTITDASGCTTVNVDSLSANTLTIAIIGIDATCYGSSDGVLGLKVSGGSLPYTYSWSTGETSEDIFGLLGECYTVTVTDATGCATTDNYCITDPVVLNSPIIYLDSCSNICDIQATAVASGGTGSISYNWNGGNAPLQQTNFGLCAGTYVVTATDVNGCTSTGTNLLTCDSTCNYSITGNVYVDGSPMTTGTVEILDASTQYVVQKATVVNGSYSAMYLCNGDYKIRAIPGGVDASNYDTTYYVSGAAFADGYELDLMASVTGLNINMLSVGIKDRGFDRSQVNIYPNPSRGNVPIDLGKRLDKTVVRITNIVGKIITETTYTNSQKINLNIDGPGGMYLVTIKSEAGRANFKLVKK
ncbi:MAG: T9SS type A sorting domain-containing protein [Bacteroidetes bacterium]|nr:T9SS type A sorting domain-containing protein [Bacteroidota bacterium]